MRIIDGVFISANGESQIALTVGVAVSWWSRFLGLMGRCELPGIDCLRFDSCSSIHTCFMRMKIDVVYLDEQNTVMKLTRELRPWRTSFCFGAETVLEFSAGRLEKLGIVEGWTFK